MQETKIVNGKRIVRREFNSITELVNYNKEGIHNVKTMGSSKSSENGAYSFTLTRNFQEALHLLNNGWETGAKKLTASLKQANAKMMDKEVKRAIFDVVGFQASVPRYLQGIPTNMVNKRTVKQKQRTINLYKCITYSANIKAERILEDSTKFLQIIQEVEKKGIRVNAYTIFHANVGDEQFMFTVKIKSAAERLSVAKMSFALMHPSFLRRIVFKTIEVEPELTKFWGNGYGQPVSGYQSKIMLDEMGVQNGVVIPVLLSDALAVALVDNIK